MDLDAHAIVAKMHGIYAIVNEGDRDPVSLTHHILAGGARIVQYRAKDGVVEAHARSMRDLTRAFDAVFIFNDDWRAALAFDADGVHMGPEDVDPADLQGVRQALKGRILGLSCGTPGEARAALSCGADYIGAGCVFPTTSKSDAGEPIGIPGLTAIASASPLPVAAIGGITLENIALVREAGVSMAAVISALTLGADARIATADLVRAWNR